MLLLAGGYLSAQLPSTQTKEEKEEAGTEGHT